MEVWDGMMDDNGGGKFMHKFFHENLIEIGKHSY